ncbi:MFS transporter [Rhodospirillum sp. A1_3_36]|uniref:MFS transporter n=1 Tax=Rhodospirillum sp. A1_3_36 TaxID=3391666 RepID=UPI0039A5875B
MRRALVGFAPGFAPGFALVITAGGLILALNLGVRQSLGLFIPDMAADLGWSTTTFGLAFAIQNLLWGLASPIAGMIADRFGTARVLVIGGLLYALSLALMSGVTSPWALHATGGLLLGMGVGFTTFPVVLGAVGRLVDPRRRGLALGIVSAGGSFGQFTMAPTTEALNQALGWSDALVAMGAISLIMVPLGLVLAGRPATAAAEGESASLGEAMTEAFGHGGYRLLTLGFFVCGFHIAFIATHLPTFVQTCGLPGGVAAGTLAVVGLFNMVGTIAAGALGDRYRKKWLLSAIYGLRAVLILVFMVAPKTELTFLLFGGSLGLLWLSTVPPTSGIIAQIFGSRYMATLFGIVMLSHQIGAFFGAWLGGLIYDMTGSFDLMWILSALLGVAAAVVNLPITDTPLNRKKADLEPSPAE